MSTMWLVQLAWRLCQSTNGTEPCHTSFSNVSFAYSSLLRLRGVYATVSSFDSEGCSRSVLGVTLKRFVSEDVTLNVKGCSKGFANGTFASVTDAMAPKIILACFGPAGVASCFTRYQNSPTAACASLIALAALPAARGAK